MKVTMTARTQPLVRIEECDHNGTQERYLNCEEYLAWCARISNEDNRLNSETAPKLLKFLMDNKHWSPNEMVNFSFEIQTSRAIAQQILRHRSFSFQEFSQRYSKVGAMEPVELRWQAAKNRQSSTDVISADPLDEHGWDLNQLVVQARNAASACYETLLEHGVAKECARMILPLSTQTTLVMNGTFRSWIHFLEQRCDGHAQKEIRLIGEEIRRQLTPEMPFTAAALGWTSGANEK